MRLLLAEDEKDLSKALVLLLKHNNYSVDAVYNGADALDYLLCGEYDAAILDIMMPLMDGLSVLKEIRKKGINIPVLMLTARSEIDDRVMGLDLGADDYLTKPFSTRELIARIRAMMRRKTSDLKTAYEYGNIKLNPNTFVLESPLGNVRLTSKEFQMLEMLISKPNQLVSTEMFMENIWGYESDVEINVVWVFVSYLRRKLTSIKANVEIKAIRGVGYTLVMSDD